MNTEKGFPHKTIEARWRRKWEESGVHTPDLRDARDKYYCLVMFLYPSASNLHIGHFFNYGPADTWARYMKMKGRRVFEPMGYDAFGLPAENYAIREGVHPAESTAANIEFIRRQLESIGAMYDWSREINTSSPRYYKWTQWLFLKLFERGLAYRARAPVNWCPGCVTVLANEQVAEGECERCGSAVTRKYMKQWFFRITDYADRLLDGLKDIDWPERTRQMQVNWIGKSEGARIIFRVDGDGPEIPVFTTRPDTIFGATYMVLAPEHPLAEKLAAGSKASGVKQYIDSARKKTEIERTLPEKEKTGVFTGSYAVNPASGGKIPVWISDYVLLSYGTGAVMAVPAHDERDFEFARAYSLPVRRVITAGEESASEPPAGAYTGEGKMVNSGRFDGMCSSRARAAIVEDLRAGGLADFATTFKLRDWLISRQRYWGAPIPVVHCPSCGEVPVPEDQLPVLLPRDVDFMPGGRARSPLETSPEFVNTSCPSCAGPARREVDTMDTFVCSSWYYLRFLDPRDDNAPFNRELVDKWLPVDIYIGGSEHAVLHLLYARFVTKFLYDEGLVGFDEPFSRLVHQGTITHKGSKMSKSRGNVVNPDEFIEAYGGDTFRMYLMFTGPFEEGGDWNDRGIKGIYRFLTRIWNLPEEESGTGAAKSSEEMDRLRHFTVKKVTGDIERFHFNTAISALMEYVNYLSTHRREISPGDWRNSFRLLILLLAPFAPHFGEELWERAGGEGSVFEQKWPAYDEQKTLAPELTLVVQVNGKVRQKLRVPAGCDGETLKRYAVSDEKVRKFTEGREIRKIVVVPDKLVNIVAV